MQTLSTDAERHTTALLAIGASLLPLQIWPAMPLPGMQLSDIFFALAFLQFVWARFRIPPLLAAAPILAFAAGAAVSTLFGGSPVKLLGHFELAALGWMGACAAPGSARWLRRALVIAAALAALTAMAGLVVFFAGAAGYDEHGIPENPLLYIHGSLVPGDYPRPRGTLVTGAMLTSVVSTGMLLLWFEPGLVPDARLRRLIHAACAIAVFFAFSRTIMALAVVLVTAELWRRDSPRWLRWSWGVIVLAYAVALWLSLRYHVVLDPTEPWNIDLLAADGDRFAKWRMAVPVVLENPVFGAGPGTLPGGDMAAHNTWLNLWAVLGIVPMLAFAVLMAAALRATARSLLLGSGCALVFHLIESSYIDVEDMRHLWLLIGIVLGSSLTASPTGPARRGVR